MASTASRSEHDVTGHISGTPESAISS
jgi:hypothetical protein